MCIETNKEEAQRREYELSSQSLKLKSVSRDLSKAVKEVEDLKAINNTLTSKLSEFESEKIKLSQRCHDLEDKIKYDSNSVS
jgi:predicted RNase H-like nuclease (RuvC/YqgF family)